MFGYKEGGKMAGNCILDEYERLIVENIKTGEQIAVITDDEVTTADEDIVVRLKPRA
jgi:hypothetical protein